jgi:K(+)-stimulated pyrophosphate-energized sodium pump
MSNLAYVVPVLGVIGLLVMFTKSMWVSKQDAGEQKMKDISLHIAQGAMAFLRAEWRVLTYFAVIVAILLGYSGTLIPDSHQERVQRTLNYSYLTSGL